MNSEQGAKPNIVLVLMDNLGWGELGVYGGGILRGAPTPRLDRLASRRISRAQFQRRGPVHTQPRGSDDGTICGAHRQRHGAVFRRELRFDPMGSHALGNAVPDRLRDG